MAMASDHGGFDVQSAPSTSGQPASMWARFWQRRADAAAARAEQEYADCLASCAGEDFSDLDALEFLTTGLADKEGRPVLCVVAKHYPARVLQLERVYKYFISTLDKLSDRPYSVLWLQTKATLWENCPGVGWLWRTYERLPPSSRHNLHRVYVLHCDLPLWLGLAAVAPALSEALWRKVEWVSRVEFLADHIAKRQLQQLPPFVLEHDGQLEEQPLMDYGIVASREVNQLPGLPGPI